MIKTEFSFGEKILVSGMLIRERGTGNKRFWSSNTHQARLAIFLNGVLLSDGTVEHDNFEGGGGLYFSPSSTLKGAWICEYNRAPRKVLLSSCHKFDPCTHKCASHP